MMMGRRRITSEHVTLKEAALSSRVHLVSGAGALAPSGAHQPPSAVCGQQAVRVEKTNTPMAACKMLDIINTS